MPLPGPVLTFFLAVLAVAAGESVAGYAVEVDGNSRGEFRQLRLAGDAGQTLVLEDGWVSREIFALWNVDPAKSLQPGSYTRPAADCDRHTITFAQSIGSGLRQRRRTWILLDGCPVAWHISAIGEEGRLMLNSLTFIARAITVSR